MAHSMRVLTPASAYDAATPHLNISIATNTCIAIWLSLISATATALSWAAPTKSVPTYEGGFRFFIEEESNSYVPFLQKREVDSLEIEGAIARMGRFSGRLIKRLNKP